MLNKNRVAMMVIIGLVVIFHFTINSLHDEDESIFYANIMVIGSNLVVGIGGVTIALTRYSDSPIFKKSFLFIGFAYLGVFVGEIMYLIYNEVFGIDPYPSWADVPFFSLYVFLMAFIIIQLKTYRNKITKTNVGFAVGITIALTSAFIIFSLVSSDKIGFDFWYGLIFVVGSSTTFAFLLLVYRLYQGSKYGVIWSIMITGILMTTFGDIWYYYLEVTGEYSLLHPVNLFWYAGTIILGFFIYSHRKMF